VNGAKAPPTKFRQQVQAHTHWINDIVLAQNNEALVSASSDITVKVWRPHAHGGSRPQTIGLHEDYVKTLASPGSSADWVASGGLDRKIYLWALNGAGQQLRINVGEEENTAKGSVYALACTPTLVAGGGPESIVRVWDPRSGKRITKFVGHTDNIRDILISQDGDMVMTASSDQTVKVWSMTAGRCMNTLTMHNDSVWSLYSDHPRLSVFYSGDRSGLVAKTDTRGCAEIDDGVSVAVCQEHGGVNKVIHAGDYLWTATSSSSINRWSDVDTEADVQVPESYSLHRASIATTKSRLPSPPIVPTALTPPPATNGTQKQIPFQSLLRLSNAAPFYLRREDSVSVAPSVRKASDPFLDPEVGGVIPVRGLPEYTIEGQHGLIKHMTLNDRRRVLTLDTNSEVVLWDLLQCAPVKSFGKRDIDDVFKEINPMESIAHWCAVDTRTGSLTCVLEENTCFDAEMYADELKIAEHIDFREDQRINLGKWVLRYLFDNLIDEEIKRDEAFRHSLLVPKDDTLIRPGAPDKIDLPESQMTSWYDSSSGPASLETPKATNGYNFPMNTPGLAIGLATPAPPPPLPSHSAQQPSLPTTFEEGENSSKTATYQADASPPATADKTGHDYFSQQPNASSAPGVTPGTMLNDGQALDASSETPLVSPNAEGQITTTPGEKASMFGKKMWKSFGMKGLKKTSTNEASKPSTVVEESSSKSEDSGSRSSKAEDERVIEDNFLGLIQRMRMDYEAQVQRYEKRDVEPGTERPPLKLESHIQPSLPNDTPVLKLPPNTIILIQEDRVDSGGVADLFEGTVGSLAASADIVEKVAPTWLGDVLLKNAIPLKEVVKVSFILEPYQNLLSSVAFDGNTRLNANRMLRARKILTYVAERIEPQPGPAEMADQNKMKTEE
jgi:WD repeat-containing protein 48